MLVYLMVMLGKDAVDEVAVTHGYHFWQTCAARVVIQTPLNVS